MVRIFATRAETIKLEGTVTSSMVRLQAVKTKLVILNKLKFVVSIAFFIRLTSEDKKTFFFSQYTFFCILLVLVIRGDLFSNSVLYVQQGSSDLDLLLS